MIGSHIEGRYRADTRLTRLGPLELFDGLDDETGQPVWIKRILAPLAQDVAFRDGWRSQLLSVKGADTPHLPRILSFGNSSDDTLYQVEERPRGITLQRLIATRGSLDADDLVSLGITLASAVGAAHRAGVAHGALSPDDLYVEEASDGALSGFIANWEGEEMALALNTLNAAVPEALTRYQAPEQQAVPPRPTTPASDVYSLALILYELLTQPLPYRVANEPRGELVPARRLNPQVPEAVERVLMRALSSDPVQRPPHGGALASALRQAMDQPAAPQPAVAPAPVATTIVTTERTRPAWPTWMPLALGAALVTICLLGLLLIRQRQLLAGPATATPASRVVPNLVGPPYLRYNEAVQRAWNNGFVISIVNFEDNPSLPPGTVLRQCPAAGALPGDVQRDCSAPNLPPPSPDTIFVDVIGLPDPVVLRVVPDLYGQSEDEARGALTSGGLSLGTRRSAFDLLMPSGRIIEQNPRRGMAVLPGTQVDYIVSAGPPTEGVSPGAIATPPSSSESFPTAAPTITLIPTATIPPTPEPATPTLEPTVPPPSTRLFEDDFEAGNANGWREQEADGVVARISGGNLQISAQAPTPFFKSEPSGLFTDFSYSATVALSPLTAGQANGAGLIFRSQGEDGYYFFEINNQGEYRLRARLKGEWLDIVPWTANSAVLTEGRPNELQVVARGTEVSLSDNGTLLSPVALPPDATFLSGAIGLAVEGVDAPTQATFDNVAVEN